MLARQHLLERSPRPLPRVLEDMGTLQAQYAPSMYVGLWSRMEGLQRAAVTRALENRSVVQATLMRGTIHLVSRADYWPLAIAIREARRTSWLRAARASAQDLTAAAAKLRHALSGGGQLRRKEIEALVGKPLAFAVGLWVDLVRVPPSGTWERRRADLYALAEDWVGPEPAIAHDAAIDHLVRRYLTGFGPAARADVANWAGTTVGTVAPAIERLELRSQEAEDGTALVDLPGGALPGPDTPAPVRFLPTWDATLLVHCRRTGILPEEHRPRIFTTKNPHSTPTFFVEGAVAGAWRHEHGEVRLEPYGELDAATLGAVRDEAARLAAWHA